MGKSIKLQDNFYLDSTGIVHNQNVLSNILNNINTLLTSLTTFSTNEINTGIKWVDGKDIYQKTIIDTNRHTGNFAIDTILGIDTIIEFSGSVKNSNNDTQSIPACNPTNNAWNINAYLGSDGRINVELGSNVTSNRIVLTLKYTKTTN